MFADLPGPRVNVSQRRADALVSIAQDSREPVVLDGGSSEGSEPLVTVFVDGGLAAGSQGEAGAEIEFGPRVGPAVLDRILCEGRVQLVGLLDGKPVVTSSATRAIPPMMRRFVKWRDGGCTIAGCHSRYRLQVHHIRPRAGGGGHDSDNLTTLCWFHHHVVIHGLGFRIDRPRFVAAGPSLSAQLRQWIGSARLAGRDCDYPGCEPRSTLCLEASGRNGQSRRHGTSVAVHQRTIAAGNHPIRERGGRARKILGKYTMSRLSGQPADEAADPLRDQPKSLDRLVGISFML
jgi:hypothetical protein